MVSFPVKIRTYLYITYFMENYVIADNLHYDSDHDEQFDSDQGIMCATLNITRGQEEMG
jgi:hypothetical protein